MEEGRRKCICQRLKSPSDEEKAAGRFLFAPLMQANVEGYAISWGGVEKSKKEILKMQVAHKPAGEQNTYAV